MTKDFAILTGLPAGTKATGGRRADARPDDWDYLVATKGGRFWWSRGAQCPCEGNAQTQQADPSCTLCRGTGWWYFKPEDAAEGDLDVAGHAIEVNDADNALSIQAHIGGVTNDTRIFEQLGKWIEGVGMVTTSRYNRLGYRDKLEARDQLINFSQLVKATGNTTIPITRNRSNYGLWTKVAHVNKLRTVSTVYTPGDDFRVTDDGTVEWLVTPPTSGTQLSIHAAFHPTWIVLEFPSAARDTLVQKKTKNLTVPEQFTKLPMRAMAKLDFLLDGQ